MGFLDPMQMMGGLMGGKGGGGRSPFMQGSSMMTSPWMQQAPQNAAGYTFSPFFPSGSMPPGMQPPMPPWMQPPMPPWMQPPMPPWMQPPMPPWMQPGQGPPEWWNQAPPWMSQPDQPGTAPQPPGQPAQAQQPMAPQAAPAQAAPAPGSPAPLGRSITNPGFLTGQTAHRQAQPSLFAPQAAPAWVNPGNQLGTWGQSTFNAGAQAPPPQQPAAPQPAPTPRYDMTVNSPIMTRNRLNLVR